MVFNSYSFMIFFIVVLTVSRMKLAWGFRKGFLLLASYVFYAAWNPPFVLLLWFSTGVDWFVAKGLVGASSSAKRRLLVLVSLMANLGLLAYFKYGGFMLDNFVSVVNWMGWQFEPARPDIILPVGISFYTFQTLSYTLDVFRGKIRPGKSFLDYALYVTFFPQLVAGPIVRAADFLPQCERPRRASSGQLGWGFSLMVLGLFQKIVIADGMMAPVVELAFDTIGYSGTVNAWIGAMAFSMQIFCDFAGYSSCAIGAALCLGFEIPDNFRFPYASIGFSDFWSRWHVSLSTWLRDYLYIPMGGNRRGTGRTYVNLMVTMLMGGLWHGAGWTFVAWGALHGLYLAIERVLRNAVPDSKFWHRRPVAALLAALTFLLVSITWVFFRAKSFGKAHLILTSIFGLAEQSASLQLPGKRLVVLVVLLLLGAHWVLRNRSMESVTQRLPWWVRSLALAGMLVAILMSMSGEDRAFIYFQF